MQVNDFLGADRTLGAKKFYGAFYFRRCQFANTRNIVNVLINNRLATGHQLAVSEQCLPNVTVYLLADQQHHARCRLDRLQQVFTDQWQRPDTRQRHFTFIQNRYPRLNKLRICHRTQQNNVIFSTGFFSADNFAITVIFAGTIKTVNQAVDHRTSVFATDVGDFFISEVLFDNINQKLSGQLLCLRQVVTKFFQAGFSRLERTGTHQPPASPVQYAEAITGKIK